MAVPSTDWQLGCKQLNQRGAHLLQTGQWADCVFMVGPPPHQVTVTAHKLILASASPVFEAMFFGGMAERDSPIPILDVQPDAFKALLMYIYTDKAELGSFEKACSIYYGAKKYMLPYLEKECTMFISLNLQPKNVCRAYELGQLFDEQLLVEKCLKIMELRTKEVLNDESFMEADIETVNKILSLDSLSIESELDLFRAVEKYAKIHLKGNLYKRSSLTHSDYSVSPPKKIKMIDSTLGQTLNLSSTATEMDKPIGIPIKTEDSKEDANSETGEVSIKMSQSYKEGQTSLDMYDECGLNNSQESNNGIELSSLRSAIGKIRFLTLPAASFAAGPARSALLSEPESFAVLMNIVSARADVPMPEGFSTSRVLRNQQNLMPEESNSKSEAVFRFTVLNFKTRRRSVESRPFHFHDMPWSIKLVPRFETSTNFIEGKYFGLYLRCNGVKDSAWSVGVHAELRLLAQGPRARNVAMQIHKTFTNKEHEWGFNRFVNWNDVMDPERGFLRGNAIEIEAHLLADTVSPTAYSAATVPPTPPTVPPTPPPTAMQVLNRSATTPPSVVPRLPTGIVNRPPTPSLESSSSSSTP
ncbi:hypothetical protein ABMA27_013013 [Loxostege sticticalis]|uniref:BTB domain-containing protein n=1 Tax=Loxostege sticticalis TaxID=481309 RepID=A0ABR3IDQ9_LOXSC